MNAFAVNGILIAVISIPLAILIAINAQREKDRWLLALFTFVVSLWGIGGFFIAREQDPSQSLFLWRLTHVGVIMIPAFLFHFVLVFIDKKKRGFLVLINYTLAILFGLTNLTGALICCVRYTFGQFYYDSPPTILYSAFTAYFVVAVLMAHYWLVRAFLKSVEPKRTQILYVLLGAGLGFAGGTPSFFPVFEIDVYPILNFSVPLFATFVAIGVFRYQLLRIKVIATEVLVFAIFIVLFFQLFFSQTRFEAFLRSIVLVLFLYFGYLLIRSVIREVDRREEMERLKNELEVAYAKLQELDQAKTDFLSMASHQLRSPLTVVRLGLAAMLDGTFGEVKDQRQIDAMKKMAESATRLINLIGEYLNVSRIELGKMKYNFKEQDLCALVKDIVEEYQPRAAQKKLKLTFEGGRTTPSHPSSPPLGQGRKTSLEKRGKLEGIPLVKFDEEKMRHVIVNLIDNAIKYTMKGSITVTCELDNSMIRQLDNSQGWVKVSVKDTGLGLEPEDIAVLFQKFRRAASGTMRRREGEPIEGSGLGLHVAKMFIDKHGGKIWAESPGRGQGSTFIFILPLSGPPPLSAEEMGEGGKGVELPRH
ncbi:hypothetical protein HYW17_01895 [Candidatus Uhrbacteria bacterium]|nr:hypothetical protein [Candidatus Uhrbacteria bacterium]